MFFRITFQPESFATCPVGYYVARPKGQCACHPRCYAVKDVSLLFAKWGALALLLLTLVMGFLIALAPSLHRNNYTEFPSSFISFTITASRNFASGTSLQYFAPKYRRVPTIGFDAPAQAISPPSSLDFLLQFSYAFRVPIN